ncbi:MAG: hypothetical protein ACQESK_07215 [Bacteroidota bacterium]
MLCFLLQACPNLLDDSPDFYVTIINNSDENIYNHFRGYNNTEEVPDNTLYEWSPQIREDLLIETLDTISIGLDMGTSTVIYSFMIYNASTFEANDWDTIRDEGLYDARYDLTLEELEALDFTIEYTGE